MFFLLVFLLKNLRPHAATDGPYGISNDRTNSEYFTKHPITLYILDIKWTIYKNSSKNIHARYMCSNFVFEIIYFYGTFYELLNIYNILNVHSFECRSGAPRRENDGGGSSGTPGTRPHGGGRLLGRSESRQGMAIAAVSRRARYPRDAGGGGSHCAPGL